MRLPREGGETLGGPSPQHNVKSHDLLRNLVGQKGMDQDIQKQPEGVNQPMPDSPFLQRINTGPQLIPGFSLYLYAEYLKNIHPNSEDIQFLNSLINSLGLTALFTLSI